MVANKLGLGPDPELSPLRTATVWQLRLPRVLLAAVAGAGLSLCGVIMQSLLRNPLAEPYLLWVFPRAHHRHGQLHGRVHVR